MYNWLNEQSKQVGKYIRKEKKQASPTHKKENLVTKFQHILVHTVKTIPKTESGQSHITYDKARFRMAKPTYKANWETNSYKNKTLL